MLMEPPKGPVSSLTIPSPVIHRRNRTKSQSERAAIAERGIGSIVSFCREKGHGFIKPDDGGDFIFVHVFDIEGELVPNYGDQVEYRKMLIPPKNEKYQAVHVKIISLGPGKHRTWDEPL
ncbi:unnamed protein product [Calicophoron daubneyi]|uniref:CSD domain-containing protein n=1 Tax=Calicophoron daubneyi TaxID=300641 RepID=A0AAV2TFU0_CALDB